jgi:AraC-like DNA-binding protein
MAPAFRSRWCTTLSRQWRPGDDESLADGDQAPQTTRRASDPDEAEQLVAEVYLPNRIDLPGPPAPLAMELTGLQIGTLTAGRLSYGRAVRLRTAEAQNFHVNLPLRGHAVSRSGDGDPITTGPGVAALFPPGAPADILWSADCAQLCLMVPRASLETELEHLLGRSVRDLTFGPQMDMRGPLRRHWQAALHWVLAELDQASGATRYPVAVRHIEGLVLDGLLLSHPHNYTEQLNRSTGVGAGAASAIARAVELVEERPAEPWTTIRLARAVHVSVRSLQEGFRRDLQVPPMTYLRQVRLRRVREALAQGTPDTTTVSSVASSFGFLHMSRFSAAYREAFGETPSATLRRPPGSSSS